MSIPRPKRALLAGVVALMLGAATAQTDAGVANEVSAFVIRWVELANEGDADTFARLYGDDGWARHRGGVVDVGAAAIARWALDLHRAGQRIALDEVVTGSLGGELAFARGRLRTLDATGEVSEGVWYAVLRHRGGAWRFYRTHDLLRASPRDGRRAPSAPP